MGWCGNGIYHGDDTQTMAYSFLKWAGFKDGHDELHKCFRYNKTTLTTEMKKVLVKNLPSVLKKMPNKKFWDEDMAIEWQMLLALFMDNNLKLPAKIKKMGILGSEFLMGEHAAEFDRPSTRRAVLRKFIKKAKTFKVKK